jgi:hypothetical protein
VRRLALLAVVVCVAPAFAGCAQDPGASRETLVPYPRLHDAVTYDVQGAYVELARWENGHSATGAQQVRYRVEPGPGAYDGSRALHPTFLVMTEVGSTAALARHADLYVSPEHEGVVQSVYPLAGDQSVVAFDERGYPWLFGASALFGQDVGAGKSVAFALPANLGPGTGLNLSWRVAGSEDVAGTRATKLVLEGSPSIAGALWMAPGSPWPLKADVTLKDAGVEPALRADGAYPARLTATRVRVEAGSEPVPPRNRAAAFAEDAAAASAAQAWDGFAPPDGPGAYEPYLLSDAIRDARLLDPGVQGWLKAADEPRLYRATFKEIPTPIDGIRNETWLLVFVDKADTYYQAQMGRLQPTNATTGGLPGTPVPLPGLGAPRVEQSGPAEAPASSNHGWFARDAVPAKLVPLSMGVQIVRQMFGAKDVQIFLRSFQSPPGYQYFLDGGWDGEKGEKGRYTVVYDPQTGFVQEATGHGVTARLG